MSVVNLNAEEKDLSRYPGGDLVSKGLLDLCNEIRSEEALLVLVASPGLRYLGFTIPEPEGFLRPFEDALYEALEARMPVGAHAEYNALIGKIVSFANAFGHVPAAP